MGEKLLWVLNNENYCLNNSTKQVLSFFRQISCDFRRVMWSLFSSIFNSIFRRVRCDMFS